MHEVVLRLPMDTILYPGHDYGDVPSRSLGEEIPMNWILQARSFEEFENRLRG